MFGLDDDAELYVDLEALGLVTLEGAADTVAAIARAVVATLAVSPLADLVHVVTSGVDCYGFANEERVQSVSDPDAALDLAAALSAGVRHAVGDGGTHDLRRRSPEEPWEPVVAILLRTPAHARASSPTCSGSWRRAASPWSPTPTCPAPATACAPTATGAGSSSRWAPW